MTGTNEAEIRRNTRRRRRIRREKTGLMTADPDHSKGSTGNIMADCMYVPFIMIFSQAKQYNLNDVLQQISILSTHIAELSQNLRRDTKTQ